MWKPEDDVATYKIATGRKHGLQKPESPESSNQACFGPVRNVVSRVWVAAEAPRLSRLVKYVFDGFDGGLPWCKKN